MIFHKESKVNYWELMALHKRIAKRKYYQLLLSGPDHRIVACANMERTPKKLGTESFFEDNQLLFLRNKVF